jgi:hypothetical protein
MRYVESPFCHIKEVVNAKIPFIYVIYIYNTSILLGNYLGILFIIMMIRVTSVEWI